MGIRGIAFAVALFFVSAASARTIEPISNFEDLPVRATMTAEQVRETIMAASAAIRSRPWAMTDTGAGKMIGRLNVRRHQAVVEIRYSASHYSIVYLNSGRLNHNVSDGTINAAYNTWVRELQATLDSALSSSPASPASARASAAPAAVVVPVRGGPATSVEISFWESVRDSKNPAELQAYLDQFPNGVFAPLAKARLAALAR